MVGITVLFPHIPLDRLLASGRDNLHIFFQESVFLPIKGKTTIPHRYVAANAKRHPQQSHVADVVFSFYKERRIYEKIIYK